jgi:hypothetical protein
MSGAVVKAYASETGERGYRFRCPGCEMTHAFRTEGEEPRWQFNGDVERPTVSPSLLVSWTQGKQREPRTCHSFVRDGMIQFLADCTHALAGKTVPLEPWQ